MKKFILIATLFALHSATAQVKKDTTATYDTTMFKVRPMQLDKVGLTYVPIIWTNQQTQWCYLYVTDTEASWSKVMPQKYFSTKLEAKRAIYKWIKIDKQARK